MDKIILWDFDGTLGYREGNWEEAVFELTSGKVIKTSENFNLVSLMLQNGFPWHQPQTSSFKAIKNGSDWWGYVKPKFIDIFIALGYDEATAIVKANHMSDQYTRLDKWKLYDDTISCLTKLEDHHWKNVLLTNNVPEFPSILKHLNLESFFDAVFVSSLTGFNKPNPLILNGYLETLQHDTKIIVVGDRIESDIAFATAIGAEGILVRSKETTHTQNFSNLVELTNYLLSLTI